MRIFHILNSDSLRGGEVFAIRLAVAQRRLGEQVRVFATNVVGSNLGSAVDVQIESLSSIGPRVFRLWRAAKILLSQLDIENAPVTLQANIGDTLWIGAICRLVRPRTVRLIYRHASLTSFWVRDRKFVRWVYGRLLNRCDAIASISLDTASDLLSLYPHLKGRVLIIPNGLNVEGTVPLRRRAQDASSTLQLLHVGAFTAEKNHCGLLRVAERLQRSEVKFHLTLAGDGPLRQQVAKKANSMGLSKNISFVGAVSDVKARMQRSDVLLLPSLVEGQPGVVIEAFAEQLSVIAYAVGGVGDLLSDGRGVALPAGDEEGFARTIADWPGGRNVELMTCRAHSYALEHFDVASIAARFLAIYSSVWKN